MNDLRADAVVIGGGVRGCSIAYHLAKAGVRVALLEKDQIASACSGATFALINVSAKEPGFYTALSLESARLYHGLEAELGEDLEYRPVGNMINLVEDERSLAAVAWYVEQQNRVPGVRVELLTGDEARRLEPAISSQVIAATFCAQDAHLNPFKLTLAYARAAKRLDAKILTQTRVTGIEVENDRVKGVITDRVRIRTDIVVNAAGIHSPDIGEMVGLTVPVVPCRGQVVTTERVPPLLNRPVGRLRQTADGTILIGVTNQFVGFDRRPTYEDITRNVQRAVRLFPALHNVKAVRCWAGLRPWPVDGLPIMGPVDHPKGFLLATGHSGITLAQVTGKIITELVTKGRSSIPIDEYSLLRFSAGRYYFEMDAYRRLRVGEVSVRRREN